MSTEVRGLTEDRPGRKRTLTQLRGDLRGNSTSQSSEGSHREVRKVWTSLIDNLLFRDVLIKTMAPENY